MLTDQSYQNHQHHLQKLTYQWTYRATQNRPKEACQTNDTLRNAIRQTDSLWWSHWQAKLSKRLTTAACEERLTVVQQHGDCRIPERRATEPDGHAHSETWASSTISHKVDPTDQGTHPSSTGSCHRHPRSQRRGRAPRRGTME